MIPCAYKKNLIEIESICKKKNACRERERKKREIECMWNVKATNYQLFQQLFCIYISYKNIDRCINAITVQVMFSNLSNSGGGGYRCNFLGRPTPEFRPETSSICG